MGQLTNQFVSQSYQGLFNLENANTGVTSTLQYVTDGIGNRLPMLASTSSIVITGSFRGDGSGLTGVTTTLPSGVVSGSVQIVDLGFATTSSLNTLSGSIASTDLGQNNRLTSLEQFTGSIDTGYVSEVEFGNYTSSMNSFTSSIDGRVDALEIETGSLQNQINGLATTGSLSGYTTITTFNNYTSSNDSKVNSLIAGTGSYATTSSLTALSQSIATTDLNQDNRLGSLESKTGSYATTGSNNFVGQQRINGNLIVTGSITSTQEVNAGNGVYTSFVQGPSTLNLNATNFIDVKTNVSGPSRKVRIYNNVVGDTSVPVEITGSLVVTGNISATSASITYLETVYETASVIYSSGSNQFGDASNDTQTLFGTVNLPSGPLVITGSVTSTGGFTGSLQGTASNAISSSHSVNADTASYVLNAVSSSHSEYADDAGLLNGTGSGVFATTGSNNFVGQQNINGNLNVTGNTYLSGTLFVEDTSTYDGDLFIKSGSQLNFNINDGLDGKYYRVGRKVSGEFGIVQDPGNLHLFDISSSFAEFLPPTYFISGAFATGSLQVRSGSLSTISNNTTINIDNYLTSSLGGQSNIIKGWGDNPTPSGPQSNINNYTGSLRITGSNNIVSLPLIRATGVGGGVDQQGYISGSDNTIASNASGIFLNTGSLLFPKTTNNYVGANSQIMMSFTTSSLAGGHPIIANNTLYAGALVINSNSGSIQSLAGNLVNGGNITSTQNFVTNTRPIISTNYVNALVTLNHISSSINYQQNYNNSPITVNNHLSSSITNNSLSIISNQFLGGSTNTGVSIWVSGSQSTNNARNIVDNLIGGKNTTISSSFVSASNSSLAATVVYGQSLSVNGNSGTGTAAGGAAFLGRFNDTGSLANSNDIVFAVGTGTAAATRRTGFYITSGSLVGVSGSLDVKGNSTFTGSAIMSSSTTFPLYVSGTIQTQRLHFDGNPFNTNPSSNLGAIRIDSLNQTFYSTMYDYAQITTQSLVGQTVITGSNLVKTSLQSSNGGTDAYVDLINSAGTRTLDVKVDTAVITGSLNVTGSVTIANAGDLTMYGHKMFNAAEFWSNTTQSGSAGVSGSLNFDASGSAVGVSLVSGSRLTVANGGTYNVQFSAQIETSAGSDTAYVWFKKNGTNIGDSATKVVLANNTAQVMTVNILDEAAANDYYELGYQFTNGNATVLSETASGNIPAIPSVIATVTQAR